jgi:hypothetical protein
MTEIQEPEPVEQTGSRSRKSRKKRAAPNPDAKPRVVGDWIVRSDSSLRKFRSQHEARRVACPDGAVKHVNYGVPVVSAAVGDGDDVYVAWNPQGDIAVFATELPALTWATPEVFYLEDGGTIPL